MTLGWIILIVVAHEEPHPEVVPQNCGLHELAQRTAKAHRHVNSLGYSCCQLTLWNIGGSWGRHFVELCGDSGVQFYGFMVCLVGLFMELLARPWAMSMDVQKIMQRVIMTLVAMRVPYCSAHYTCSVLLVLMGPQCPIPCVVASHGLNRCTGSALSYTYHCTGLFVINALHSWKLWPLAWTCPISRKWLGWNIEWISQTLKDSPAFKQHYSYKNNRDKQ